MQADHAKSKKMIWKRDTVRKCRARRSGGRRSSSHGCYVLSVDATVDAIPGVGDMIFPEHTHLQTTRHGLIHFATRNIAST